MCNPVKKYDPGRKCEASIGSALPPTMGNMPLNRAAQTLTTLPLGTRVVVRYRIAGGLTDALGYLRSATDTQCMVETRTSEVVIDLADVQAAKEVPPPPPRRP